MHLHVPSRFCPLSAPGLLRQAGERLFVWSASCMMLVAVAAGRLPAADADPAALERFEKLEHFEKAIRPVLVRECIRCHGPEKQQGGLRLDSREGWAAGGDSGAAIVPGDPAASLLIEAIRYEGYEMPPRGRLDNQTLAAFERWVASGAVDPREGTEPGGDGGPPTVAEGKSFWAFQPPTAPAVPAVGSHAWPHSDIDAFVWKRLEEAGLAPSPDADRRTLVRRVYFDLTGLPPTPAEIEAFLADDRDDALAALVDQLLQSPRFGEQWGRHWLDVVRFAESSGGGRSLLFPNAWRYRDYVIESLNEDIPYDQFLREQLAGDLLEANDWRQRRRQLVATAFLLLGPTNYELQDKDQLEMDVVDEQLDTLGKATMGMTLGCARCHDHKFDPIPMEDYYALAGIFKSTRAMIHSNVSQWNTVALPPSPQQAAERAAYQAKLSEAEAALQQARQAWVAAGGMPADAAPAGKGVAPASLAGTVVDDLDAERTGAWKESTSIAAYVGAHYVHDAGEDRGQKAITFRTQLPRPGVYEVRVAYSASSNRASNVPVEIRHAAGATTRHVNQRKQPPIAGLFTSLGEYTFAEGDSAEVVIRNAGTNDGVVIADAVQWVWVADAGIKHRAASKQLAQAEERRAGLRKAYRERKQAFEQLKKQAPPRDVAMVAEDEAEPADIPLAIRGVVHHAGSIVPRGVLQVASANPFPAIDEGQSGRKELADWLTRPNHPLTARVIVNRVWYWLFGNGLVRTVDNFGQMGEVPSHPELLDHLATEFVADGWSIKRLVRRIVLSRVYRQSSADDAAKAAVDPNNRLLWRMHRRRLRAEEMRDAMLLVSGQLDPEHGGTNIKAGTRSEYGYEFESTRRSVYLPVFRNTLPEWFEVFDFPDPNTQRGSRSSSTVASQALLMMNHPAVWEWAEQAARRSQKTGAAADARIDATYRQVLGRPATPAEREATRHFLDSGDGAETRWAMLYQTLFQSIDFRFLH